MEFQMSKRRVANRLMFRSNHGIKPGYGPAIVARLSGTGTVAAQGVFTVLCASGVAASAAGIYLTVSSGTNIGTLVGTGR